MPKIQLLLILFLFYGCILPPSSTDRAVNRAPSLPIQTQPIQTMAVSDVDGDQLLDRATVSGTGPNKSIRVCFSHNHGSSILSFSSASPGAGSLLASDVDHDGDIDLVWTDLANSGEVVVWLNDGLGGFERAPLGTFAGAFVIGGRGLAEGGSTERQNAGGSSRRAPSNPGLTPHPRALLSQDIYYGGRPGWAKTLHSALLDPERGPPALQI